MTLTSTFKPLAGIEFARNYTTFANTIKTNPENHYIIKSDEKTRQEQQGPLKKIRASWRDMNRHYYFMRDEDGLLIGAASFRRSSTEPNIYILDDIEIYPAYRDQKIELSQALFDAVERFVANHNAELIDNNGYAAKLKPPSITQASIETPSTDMTAIPPTVPNTEQLSAAIK